MAMEMPPLPSEALLEKLAPFSPVPARPDLSARQAPDVFALWTAWEEESGERRDIPYWSTVWPAAQMLARFIAENPRKVEGRSVLDFGCGSGVAGIAAAKAGARRVVANDIDPVALVITRGNAAANGCKVETDGRDLLSIPDASAFDVILVCDLFYEKGVSERLIAWLGQAHRRGAEVLIADSSRPFSPTHGVRTLAQERFPTDADLEGARERTVRLLTLNP